MTSQKSARNKHRGSEIGLDIFYGWEQKRIINKKAMQEVEVLRMRKLHEIYQREINFEIPQHLEFIKKHYEALGIKGLTYYTSKIKVQEGDFEKKKWLYQMKDASGFFKYEAEQIVKIVCEFQIIKKNRMIGSGYKTDPENLFCEELKTWATATLCMMDCSTKTKELINKRCRYLEEVLCEDGLFDRPSSLITHTIQQVIVACRGVLKYRALPIIDRELAHHDARKAFDSIKINLVMLIADTLEFVSNVFRISKPKQNYQDKIGQILDAVMSSENIASAFPNDQAEIRDKIYAPGKYGALLKPRSVLLLGANNEIFMSPIHTPHIKGGTQPQTDPTVTTELNLLKLTEAHLRKMFVGSESGIEEKFRSNSQITLHYLKTIALVLEVGDFYKVIEKAAACASQGGTLLVYGLANTHLNIMLESCEHLMGSLREGCSTLSRVAELRFEELVFQNNATVKRNPWIKFFRTTHSSLARIDKTLATISQETALIKVQANSLTLYEMFQKASDDTTQFLDAASDFADHMSKVLGVAYSLPKNQQVVSLPDIKELKSLCGGSADMDLTKKKNKNLPSKPESDNENSNPLDEKSELETIPSESKTKSTHKLNDFFSKESKKKKKKKSPSTLSPPEISSPNPHSKIKFAVGGEKNFSEEKHRKMSQENPGVTFSEDIEKSFDEKPQIITREVNPFGEDNNNPFGGDESITIEIHSSTSDTLGDHFFSGNINNEREEGLFNLTRKLTRLSMGMESRITGTIIMDHQKLDTTDLPLLKSKINGEITKVELMCNKLNGSDIVELCSFFEKTCLKSLITINLADNFIGDEGAKAFGNYLIEPDCVLQSLTLSNNKITDKGGLSLVESLEENTSLMILNLDCNELTDITLEKIEKSLLANPKCPLSNLCLAEHQNRFTKQGAKCLWRLMASRPKLSVTGDPPFTLGGIDSDPNEIRKILKPSKLERAKGLLNIGQEYDVFHNIALESIQRLRDLSVQIISYEENG